MKWDRKAAALAASTLGVLGLGGGITAAVAGSDSPAPVQRMIVRPANAPVSQSSTQTPTVSPSPSGTIKASASTTTEASPVTQPSDTSSAPAPAPTTSSDPQPVPVTSSETVTPVPSTVPSWANPCRPGHNGQVPHGCPTP